MSERRDACAMLVARQALVLGASNVGSYFEVVILIQPGPVCRALVFQILLVQGAVALIPHQKSAAAVNGEIWETPSVRTVGVVEAGDADSGCKLCSGVRGRHEDAVFGHADPTVARQRGIQA